MAAKQADTRRLFDNRIEVLPSRFAEIDFNTEKSVTALDLNRCISVIVYSESKNKGYVGYLTHADRVGEFISWLESKNLDKSGLRVYLVGGNDETYAAGTKSLDKYDVKDRSSAGIVNVLTEALSKAGYRICGDALYGELSRDVSLTSDGQVLITDRRIKKAGTINLTQSSMIDPQNLDVMTESLRQLAGHRWRNAIYKLKEDPEEVRETARFLASLAIQHNVPSLAFAAKQLQFFLKNGIQTVNMGGTMGSGKSHIAEKLAELLGWEFKDSDDFHTEENKEKMSKNIPLTDEDRFTFYRGVVNFLGPKRITTCSGLTGKYKAILAGQSPEILLDSDYKADPWRDIISERLGLLQVMVLKPYETALIELDEAEKNPARKRKLGDKDHFIHVTIESEEKAENEGKEGVLKSQYTLYNSSMGDPWTYITLDTQDFSAGPNQYDGMGMLKNLLGLKYQQ